MTLSSALNIVDSRISGVGLGLCWKSQIMESLQRGADDEPKNKTTVS